MSRVPCHLQLVQRNLSGVGLYDILNRKTSSETDRSTATTPVTIGAREEREGRNSYTRVPPGPETLEAKSVRDRYTRVAAIANMTSPGNWNI